MLASKRITDAVHVPAEVLKAGAVGLHPPYRFLWGRTNAEGAAVSLDPAFPTVRPLAQFVDGLTLIVPKVFPHHSPGSGSNSIAVHTCTLDT